MLATVLVIAVIAALMTAAAVTGRPTEAREASAATWYLPASGARVVVEHSAGGDQVDEYLVGPGLGALQSGPSTLGYAATENDEFQRTTWVRISSLTADADVQVKERGTQLFAALATGLELRVATWPDRFLAFRPGMLMLPSGVRDGQEWSVAGTAYGGTPTTLDDQSPYSAEFRASAAGDGCVAVTGTIRLGGGTDPASSSSTTTWCAGRGITATTLGDDTASAVNRWPVWSGRTPIADPVPLTITARGGLERRDLTGLPPMALSPRVAPVVLPGELVVFANNIGGDLVARGWDDGQVDARWAAHPGGAITGLLAVDRVVLAATAERRLVAYGSEGEFLWQADLPDATGAPPVRLSNLAVVTTLDGGVSAYDAATGALVWRHQVPNEIRQPPSVSGDVVTVMDQAGNLRSYRADGAEVHSLELDQPESFTVAAGLAVVASRTDGFVRGYRLDDGSLAWRTSVPGARNSIHALADVVVVRQGEGLLALHSGDGTRAWEVGLRPTTIAAVGDQLLVSDRTNLLLFDATGAQRASWPTQESDLDSGTQTFLTTDAGLAMLSYGSVGYRWRAS